MENIIFENHHKYKIIFKEHPFLNECEKDEEYFIVAYIEKGKIAFLKRNKISFYHKLKDVLYWGDVKIIKDYGTIK